MISKSISWSTWMTVRVESESSSRSARVQLHVYSRSPPLYRVTAKQRVDHGGRSQRERPQDQLTLLIPVGDLSRLPARVVGVLGDGLGVLLVVLAPLENLCSRIASPMVSFPRCVEAGAERREREKRGTGLTFLRTLEETLGRGIGLSDSPTSGLVCRRERERRSAAVRANPLARAGLRGRASCVVCRRGKELTLDHVLDEDGAVGDILLDGELLVVGAVGEPSVGRVEIVRGGRTWF